MNFEGGIRWPEEEDVVRNVATLLRIERDDSEPVRNAWPGDSKDFGAGKPMLKRLKAYFWALRELIRTSNLAKTLQGRVDMLQSSLREADTRTGNLDGRIESQNAHIESLGGRIESLNARIESLDAAKDSIEGLHKWNREIVSHLERLDTRLDRLEGDIGNISSRTDEADSLRHRTMVDLAEVRREAELQRRAYSELSLRLSRPPRPAASDDVRLTGAEAFLPAFYTRFEDRFRGSRDEIKERLKIYLPELESVRRRKGKTVVVDLGCGRGEWLELATEQGFEPIGVDTNEVQAEDARGKGLTVELDDALSWLQKREDNSIDFLTSMHMVEHMPFDVTVRLLQEASRVLRPGGMLVLETPNPESLLVGAYKFHLDPTHNKPLPPELMQVLVETIGLSDIRVLRLHDDPRRALMVAEQRLDAEVAALLYGSRDYAIIARRST
jgi:O-antigen chain-terminating methyltransferase